MTSNPSSKLLIIADDLTGALDSGVQLTHQGRHVVINTDGAEMSEADSDVIVIDTETRHLPREEAYRKVYELVRRACASGIRHIYKKTDSGLRGNVGAELTAVLDACGADHLNFIPAYPQMGRITRGGIHYVNGTPLAASVFAQDPIDPVTESRIDRLIHQQSKAAVCASNDPHPSGIVVYDAETEEDMQRIAEQLDARDDLYLAAGCAGFLEKYPGIRRPSEQPVLPQLPSRLIVISGSVNAVTLQQLNYAEAHGAARYHVPLEKAMRGSWSAAEKREYLSGILQSCPGSSLIVIDTLSSGLDRLEKQPLERLASIDRAMGELAEIASDMCRGCSLMIIGGDTLHGLIQAERISQLYPVAEIDSGIVLARYEKDGDMHYLITKSGGFGKEEQLENILRWLNR